MQKGAIANMKIINLLHYVNPLVRRGFFYGLGILMLFTSACNSQADDDLEDSDKPVRKGTYVNPSVDYRGRYRKGHFRKAYSTDKNAIKNQARSRYYYHTRGKYRNKN